MTRWKRRSDRSGRAPLPSPGRPPVAGRNELEGFGQRLRGGERINKRGFGGGQPGPIDAIFATAHHAVPAAAPWVRKRPQIAPPSRASMTCDANCPACAPRRDACFASRNARCWSLIPSRSILLPSSPPPSPCAARRTRSAMPSALELASDPAMAAFAKSWRRG